MASLIHMQKILSSRMQHFSSIEKAVSSGSITYFYSYLVEITFTFWLGWGDLVYFPDFPHQLFCPFEFLKG